LFWIARPTFYWEGHPRRVKGGGEGKKKKSEGGGEKKSPSVGKLRRLKEKAPNIYFPRGEGGKEKKKREKEIKHLQKKPLNHASTRKGERKGTRPRRLPRSIAFLSRKGNCRLRRGAGRKKGEGGGERKESPDLFS